MSLEAATYVSQLSASNPVGASDLVSQGDDHIRLIKAALQATFPNASRALYFPTGAAVQTATVTILATDQSKLYPVSAAAAARTVNLPANAGIPDGFEVTVLKSDYGPNAVTIDGNASDTINGALTLILTKAYQHAKLTWNTAASAWFARVDTVIPTGIKAPYGGGTVPAGWVFANGINTIGNASSGATLASVTTEALFHHLYNTYTNAVCAVSGGRGADAATDYAANKTIVMPDLRGKTVFGATAMGGVAESTTLTDAVAGVDVSVPGVTIGAQDVAFGLLNLPDHGITITDLGHTHSQGSLFAPSGTVASGPFALSGSSTSGSTGLAFTGITAAFGLAARGGAQTNVNKLPPGFVDNWIMAL